MRNSTLILLLLLPLVVAGLVASWFLWTERNPERERDLRVGAHQQLQEWFPEAMSLPEELVGFYRHESVSATSSPDVVLIHGLDEPGGIWEETVPALSAAGLVGWEFRYPNDQAIDHSVDLLAEYWETLDPAEPVVLVGHSMGGLVIRDFVSRWRHPTDGAARVAGPAVQGVILVATPNQGSAWARLRAWLDLREWASDIPEGRFSPFARLRDGTGAAKIDLRPDSRFLTELNARPWPAQVPRLLIGGQLTEPEAELLESLDELGEELGITELRSRVEAWWQETGDGVGDGAVPVESLRLADGPEPVILSASHRGLLVTMPFSEDEPPAIGRIVEQVLTWRGTD